MNIEDLVIKEGVLCGLVAAGIKITQEIIDKYKREIKDPKEYAILMPFILLSKSYSIPFLIE